MKRREKSKKKKIKRISAQGTGAQRQKKSEANLASGFLLLRVYCQTKDCFVASLLAMTKGALSCHCEPLRLPVRRQEQGRGNLKCPAIVFSNKPFRGNDKKKTPPYPSTLLRTGIAGLNNSLFTNNYRLTTI